MINTKPVHKYQLYPFWDDEFKKLNYIVEPFNDPVSVSQWIGQGYPPKFVGELCDMRHRLPTWSNRLVEMFEGQGWKDIGLAFYRMPTGTVLPTHGDLYKKYIELFDLTGQEHTIRRAIVMLEDWKSGHYLEVRSVPIVDWRAGQVVEWAYDTPHMAANIGLEDRYTLQITGHVDD
jgi:hypothetical protein